MRILVTGGAGFIGSHTVDRLLAEGYQVCILDNLQSWVHPKGKPSYLPQEAEFVLGDVRDRAALNQALQGVDVVFHLAAYQDYMPDFSTFFLVNTVSTVLLYELIVENKYPVQKVVLASSQAVYGEGKYQCTNDQCPMTNSQFPAQRSEEQLRRGDWEVRCPGCRAEMEPLPIDEETPHPHTAYGISKYALELAAFALGRRYSIPTVALRYSIVQGPRNSYYNAYSGACRIFTMRVLNGKPPILYEDGQQLRDYVYVGDVVEANLLVLENDAADGLAFNVAGMRPVTVEELAHLIVAACGSGVEPEIPGVFRFGDTRHTVSDAGRLRALGWQPKTPVETIVEEYVAWVRAQPDWQDVYEQAEREMVQVRVLRQVRSKQKER